MKPLNFKRPHRSMVRCKAKMQLLQASEACFEWTERDEILLQELAETLFQSHQYQTIYQQCQSLLEVHQVDNQLIQELTATYQQISQRQLDPIVQHLNALL